MFVKNKRISCKQQAEVWDSRLKVRRNSSRIIIDIFCAIKYRKNMDTPFHNKVMLLKKDLDNIINHVFGSHEQCDSYYWPGQKEGEVNELLCLQDSETISKLRFIISRLRINAKSLIYDLDSNRIEQFHSLVAKKVGGKRINFSISQSTSRCKFAVLQQSPFLLAKSILNRSPSNTINQVE